MYDSIESNILICPYRSGADPGFFWVGDQVHNLCIVSNMKRRGVWGYRRINPSNLEFFEGINEYFVLQKITKW